MSSLPKICPANIKKEGVNLPVGVLKNISKKLTGKYLCRTLVFNKISGRKTVTLLKKISDTSILGVFCKLF